MYFHMVVTDRIGILHKRLSEAGEPVFFFRERASKLISLDCDLEIQFLCELHFPWVTILEVLEISTKTLTRS